MEKPVNLIRGLLTAIIIHGLILLNSTVIVWAADVPFIDEISGKVQLAISPSPPAFWKLLKIVDTEEIIDHQNDNYKILEGQVSVVFLSDWKSVSVFGDKYKTLIDKVSNFNANVFSYVVKIDEIYLNTHKPYLFIFYNSGALDDVKMICLVKDILEKITNTHEVGDVFDIKACSEEF